MSEELSRKSQYERALRWYPAEWRRVHGPALVGDLMDQDDARGRQRPAVGDRLSLVAQGLKARSLQLSAPSSTALTLRIIGLTGAAFITICYWIISPSDVVGSLPAGTSLLPSHEPKTLLNNGTVVSAVLLALGLAASLARREPLARILAALAALAAVAALVVTQLAVGTGGGPDGPTGATLVILAVMGAVPVRRWTVVPGFIALVASAVLLELWLAWASPILAVAASACGLAAAVVGLIALRQGLRPTRPENRRQ